MRITAVIGALLALAGACGGDDPSFDYPLDDSLRLHHVRARGTHNSYHVAPDPFVVADWNYSHSDLDAQLSDEGVRQLELDLNYDFARARFDVYHLVAADEGTTCALFVECLETIARWSRRNPGHAPVAVMIEPKDIFGADYADELMDTMDAEIRSVFDDDEVITPDFVMGAEASLAEALAGDGWPTLGEVRGRVLFWIDNNNDWRQVYSRGDVGLDGRMAFVDSDLDASYAAVRVLNNPVSLAVEIEEAAQAGQLIRTRVDTVGADAIELDTTAVNAALASGAHFISSDVDEFSIPGAMPFVCNPLTAPADCTATAIEDPQFVD